MNDFCRPGHIIIMYQISNHSGKPVPLPRPDRKHKPIPVSELGAHVTQLHENSNQQFKVEYDVSWLNLVLLNVINVPPTYAVSLQRRRNVYCCRQCSS